MNPRLMKLTNIYVEVILLVVEHQTIFDIRHAA
jgi:hypothetical protein